MNLSVVAAFSMLIGFGSLPILPCLCRCLHPNFDHYIVITTTLIYFVHYHIINCVKEHRIIGGEETWVGEDEGAAEGGVDRGLEEGPTATYHPGKDQDGYTVEGHAGGYITRTFKQPYQRFLGRLLFHLRFPSHRLHPL